MLSWPFAFFPQNVEPSPLQFEKFTVWVAKNESRNHLTPHKDLHNFCWACIRSSSKNADYGAHPFFVHKPFPFHNLKRFPDVVPPIPKSYFRLLQSALFFLDYLVLVSPGHLLLSLPNSNNLLPRVPSVCPIPLETFQAKREPTPPPPKSSNRTFSFYSR